MIQSGKLPQLFILGGTGHIGGAVVDLILREHPELPLNCLIRDHEKATHLKSKYPDAKISCCIGDLSSLQEIQAASQRADIVINMAPDITHEDSTAAILRGLKDRERRGYYLHTSGATMIWDINAADGEDNGRIWDDIADINELTSMPTVATHSVTDKMVRSASDDVNVAIVSPSGVLGTSPSIEHPAPIALVPYVTTALGFGSAFQIEEGKNRTAVIDVMDMARIYLLLLNRALSELDSKTYPVNHPSDDTMDIWGPKAYYFGVSEEVTSAQYGKVIAASMHKRGKLPSTKVISTSTKDAARMSVAKGGEFDPDARPPAMDSWAMHVAVSYGMNMRVIGSRIRALGWVPEAKPVLETMDEAVGWALVMYEKSIAEGN